MGARGKTAANVGKVAIEKIKYPTIPKGKTKEFKKRWREIVHSFPASFWHLGDMYKLITYIDNEFLIQTYRTAAAESDGMIKGENGELKIHPLHKQADSLTRINIALSNNLRISGPARNRANDRNELKTPNAPNSGQNRVRPMFQSVG